MTDDEPPLGAGRCRPARRRSIDRLYAGVQNLAKNNVQRPDHMRELKLITFSAQNSLGK
jgi:hypothetical protein